MKTKRTSKIYTRLLLGFSTLILVGSSRVPATEDLYAQVMGATTGDVFTLAADTTYTWGKLVGFGSPDICVSTDYCSSATNVTLQGEGAGSSVLDAEGKTFFFHLITGGHLTLKDLTLTNGNGDGGGSVMGAIYNRGGNLVLDRVAFLNNKGSHVGAIACTTLSGVSGSTELNACSFTGNTFWVLPPTPGSAVAAGAIHADAGQVNGASTCSFYDSNSDPVCHGLICPSPLHTTPSPLPTTPSSGANQNIVLTQALLLVTTVVALIVQS
jgi:hypothetical protein